MHAYLGVLIFFILAYLFYSFNKKFMMLFPLGAGVALIVVCFICSSGKVDKLSFINATNLDEIEVPQSGVFYLSTGANAWLSNAFIMSDTQTIDDINDYIKSARDDVYINIKDGDTINYSSNLGLFLEYEDAEKIMQIYDSWRDSGTVPNEKVRYDFLCFYVEY